MQCELDGLKQSSHHAIAKAARAANRVLAQGAERGAELRERGQVGVSLAHHLLTTYSLLAHCLLTAYSLLTYHLLTTSLLTHYLLTACSLLTHCLLTACSLPYWLTG